MMQPNQPKQPAQGQRPDQADVPAAQMLNASHPAESPLQAPPRGTPLHMMSAKQQLGYAVQNGYLDSQTARDIVGNRTPISALSDPRLRGLGTAMRMGDKNWRMPGSQPNRTMFGKVAAAQQPTARPGATGWQDPVGPSWA
jgi:hypothetical protein